MTHRGVGEVRRRVALPTDRASSPPGRVPPVAGSVLREPIWDQRRSEKGWVEGLGGFLFGWTWFADHSGSTIPKTRSIEHHC